MGLEDITAAILAGGMGTRLAKVVPGQQKVVAKVRNHPFLEYILNQLNTAGFKNVVICTGYLSHQVEKAFGTQYKNLHLLYSKEFNPLGTAGSLRNALSLLSSTTLVMNGDTFCKINLKKLLDFHIHKKSNATIVLSKVSDSSRFGTVQLEIDDCIVGFQEKKAGSGAGIVNNGIYLIQKSFIAEILQNKVISLEKDIFPTWIGKSFYGYKTNGSFIDIGTPESYQQAEKFFSQHSL